MCNLNILKTYVNRSNILIQVLLSLTVASGSELDYT